MNICSSNNLLIHGDNLIGLQSLEKDYTGKIKCIYIDPPYNTKKSFIHYNDSLDHSIWIDMMKERVVALHKLLSEDGSFWVSIDDKECHYLKIMCDEIFGRKNFIANIIWERHWGKHSDTKWISASHDNILAYSKNKKLSKGLNLLPRTEKMDKRYTNIDNDPRGKWMGETLWITEWKKRKTYPLKNSKGKEFYPPPGRCWIYSEKKIKELIRDNRIWFGKKGNNKPSQKRFLSEVQNGTVTRTIWLGGEVGYSTEAKKEAVSLNSKDVFTTPKPERLVQRIINLASKPGDIVLDCFAGSGTTGAVAHKMGRKWIMVEIGDHCKTHIIPRINKVIEGKDLGGITEDINWKGGGGFEYRKI